MKEEKKESKLNGIHVYEDNIETLENKKSYEEIELEQKLERDFYKKELRKIEEFILLRENSNEINTSEEDSTKEYNREEKTENLKIKNKEKTLNKFKNKINFNKKNLLVFLIIIISSILFIYCINYFVFETKYDKNISKENIIICENIINSNLEINN